MQREAGPPVPTVTLAEVPVGGGKKKKKRKKRGKPAAPQPGPAGRPEEEREPKPPQPSKGDQGPRKKAGEAPSQKGGKTATVVKLDPPPLH